jgi:hypothetical protein
MPTNVTAAAPVWRLQLRQWQKLTASGSSSSS